MNQVTYEQADKGNGTKLPWQVRIDGELLRTKGGVARRFKTKEGAEWFVNFSVNSPIKQ